MSFLSSKLSSHDRFIPLRKNENTPFSCINTPNSPIELSHSNSKQAISYEQHIRRNYGIEPKVLTWNQDRPHQGTMGFPCTLSKTLSDLSITTQTDPSTKGIAKHPEKVLDAPCIRDDFYLNVIDWNEDGRLGVALDGEVYLYTPQQLIQLCKSPFMSYISSIRFCKTIVAVGSSRGQLEIYDLEKLAVLRTFSAHCKRISSIDFLQTTMITGSKDRSIKIHDLRLQKSVVSTYQRHEGQVCSIKVKNDLDTTFASGSNDNSVMVWDLRKRYEIWKLQGHNAAVKGLAWCPWKNGYLTSGGGTGDKSIKLWNTMEGSLLSTRQTGSQVSSLLWNTKSQTLISTHGYPNHDIKIWKLNKSKLNQETSMKGHSARILSMASSPDQQIICTAGADQTLKFWRVFGENCSSCNFALPRCSLGRIR